MKLVAQIKLLASPDQKQALLATLQAANRVCNRISAHAWKNRVFKQFDLHKACYRFSREESGLSSQVVIRCLSKVADAYKLDKARERTFRPNGSIAYDARILRFLLEKQSVSLWSVAGRLTIPFAAGERQFELLKTQKGESDLCYIGGEFNLMAVCEVEESPERPAADFLGIDLGIVQLASDSEGNQYSGESVRSLRRRMRKLKAGLQSAAKKRKSKSAKRHLQRLRRRQSRFTRWVNHNINRRLVETAVKLGKAIALEDLKGIRERGNGFNREMRFELGNWSFRQLRSFIEYKARRAGVCVVAVNPRNTSRTCSACGYCDKHNRRSQSGFQCLECGFACNADANAAKNIADKARGRVTVPVDGEVAFAFSTVKSPAL